MKNKPPGPFGSTGSPENSPRPSVPPLSPIVLKGAQKAVKAAQEGAQQAGRAAQSQAENPSIKDHINKQAQKIFDGAKHLKGELITDIGKTYKEHPLKTTGAVGGTTIGVGGAVRVEQKHQGSRTTKASTAEKADQYLEIAKNQGAKAAIEFMNAEGVAIAVQGMVIEKATNGASTVEQSTSLVAGLAQPLNMKYGKLVAKKCDKGEPRLTEATWGAREESMQTEQSHEILSPEKGTKFGDAKFPRSASIMDTPFARSLGRKDSALFRRFSEGSSTDFKQAQLYEVVNPHNSLPPSPSGEGPHYLMAMGTAFFWILVILSIGGISYIILKVSGPKK